MESPNHRECFLSGTPGPKTWALFVSGNHPPFVKCLLANRQLVSVLPDSKEFLVLAARPRKVAGAVIDATKLKVSHNPIRGKRILENFSAIPKDLLPTGNCAIPFVLSLIGARKTLVRGKLRILCHS